jgi:bacillithiol system protein YtxJ
MKWIDLRFEEQIEEIEARSREKNGVVIFKHSTRCPISASMWRSFQHAWDEQPESIPVYLINVVEDKPLSSAVSRRFGVDHESPQLIWLKDQIAQYDCSHYDINAKNLKEKIFAL